MVHKPDRGSPVYRTGLFQFRRDSRSPEAAAGGGVGEGGRRLLPLPLETAAGDVEAMARWTEPAGGWDAAALVRWEAAAAQAEKAGLLPHI